MNQFLVKPREKFTNNFPNLNYADPRCLGKINKKVKQANTDCVKEFHDEINKNIKIKNSKELVQSRC